MEQWPFWGGGASTSSGLPVSASSWQEETERGPAGGESEPHYQKAARKGEWLICLEALIECH